VSAEAETAVLEGYQAAATAERIASWEAIDDAALLRPVASFLPSPPARLAEVGAGTGRTAAWLAAKGNEVTAIEPVAALREAGMALHAGRGIDWIDDRLPGLTNLRDRTFDGVLLIAVWQHLPLASREAAMARLAAMIAPRGVLLMSLRHGPGAPGRPVYPCDPAETTGQAAGLGLSLLHREEAPSLQEGNRALGVTWTWLAFRRD
jgi:SAM-dependent methyltransferase